MSLPRTIKGSRYTGLQITWTQEISGSAQDLTASTLTGVIRDEDGNSTAITGTLALSDAANGVFQWSFSAADVATAGRYEVQFKATYGSGLYDVSFPERWVVEEVL